MCILVHFIIDCSKPCILICGLGNKRRNRATVKLNRSNQFQGKMGLASVNIVIMIIKQLKYMFCNNVMNTFYTKW